MTQTEAVPAIEVRDLTKRFGSVTAVDQVSFRVEPGELFFLLGPSGCGKTTLLRILAGLEEADAGSVFFAGSDVTHTPAHKRGAPMVFQNYALWPHLNVFDNVAFGLVEQRRPKDEIRKRVLHALARVSMEDLAHRRPAELSGGQQQRVVLARALVMNPPIVLLDEPLSNLDARLRDEMREEIGRLHRETDITFVYVTHDQAEALSLADRMAVMKSGRITALGSPRELYHRPPDLFTAGFLGEANLVAAKVTEIEDGYARVETPLGMWSAKYCGEAPAQGAVGQAVFRPEHVRHLRSTPPDTVNYFEAMIETVRMAGPLVSIQLLGHRLPLKASLPNRLSLQLESGRQAAWAVEPEETIFYPECP